RRRRSSDTPATARALLLWPAGPSSCVHLTRAGVHLRAQLPGRLLRQTTMVVRRQDLAGHGRRRLDDEPADFGPQLAGHPRVLPRGRVAVLADDLLGRGDRSLRLDFLQTLRRFARLLDELLRLVARVGEHFLTLALDRCERRIDLLGVREARRDLL